MDWSLLGCGAGGHVTFAPDEPDLRERFGHNTREGQAWRCLRCGTFVIGKPTASGPADSAPVVRRGAQVRSALILRIFAVERFLRALIFAALAIAVWRFSLSQQSLDVSYNHALPPLKALLRDLGFSVQHSKILGLLNRAFTTDPKILTYIAIGCAAYATVEVIEGVGLWLVKRWGEYFAMIATSVGLPYEIYDLTNKVTALRVAAFLINLGLVIYLVVTKRLFGVRGGKAAYEAMLRSESLLDAEIAALAAEQAEQGRHAKPGPADEPVPATEPAEIRDLFEPAPEPPATHDPFQAATDPPAAHPPFPAVTDQAAVRELFEPAPEPPAVQAPFPPAPEPPAAHDPFEPAPEPTAAHAPFPPAPEPPAAHDPFEPAPEPTAAHPPFPPAPEPPAAYDPFPAAMDPPAAHDPFPAAEMAAAEEAPPPEPPSPAADEAPDANGAGVTTPPPLPRRRRRR
jgi:uncharacterized membrane protein (DUF2068 family)